ncbi:sensor histidine kinase [Flaviramulus sp. BrNp1-15]|uniref:tetratricopeptide repeat-containing sensor histidine kinase n=1 Tax=Flaviramulus sp. BrNp1-15 TaxID=2916754 RepID=UPI001EE7D721|nr:sensor histidine kinase [Flaviramulus sp. BrNp1-15]ULC60089.1 sensor histidine kinase [Flaviramulus sp. BrNp1-15]
MKYFKILVCFLVGLNYANAQIDDKLRKIDSIKSYIAISKTLDSVSVAQEHYKIGELYRHSLLSDSAYTYFQKAEKVFRKYKLKYETAITLYGIAVVQCLDKDYTGSESTSIEVITLLESLEQNNNIKKYRAYIYNNLGIVFDELEQFDEAVRYLELSLSLKNNLQGDFNRSKGLTLNNLIKVYRRSGQYNLAFEKYDEIFNNKKLITEHPDVYVLALGNYANALYLSGNSKKLPGLYLRALNICDSINDKYNSIIIHQHLAEYYNNLNLKDSAKYYAYNAKKISEFYNNDDLLKSLLLLSKIESGEVANKFLKDYIKLSDSLQKSERAKRDKFARIRFETSQIEQENVKIARERSWLLIISIGTILTAFLLYLIITQRNKNKELQFIQKQQETNEEIYNLMLSQNENIEEARSLEKKRISEELHDGVLGRLFGTRLSLDSLNLSNSVEAVKTRGQYIEELKAIEQDIRKVSHELNTDFISGSGFIDIIKTLVETQALAYEIEYDLEHDDAINWDSISNKMKIHIYRIIQESLHNIYKHANATHVKISFKLKNNVICLTLTDDGSGFDVNKAKSGIGLKNMNSRIKEINGTINITSKKDIGTTVTIEAPIS